VFGYFNSKLTNSKLRTMISDRWFYLLFLFITLFLTRDVIFKSLISYGDFVFYSGVQPLMLQLSIWKPINLGVLESASLSEMVTSLLSLPAGPVTGQSIFIIFLTFVTITSFYSWMYSLTASKIISITSAIVYLINPVFLNQFTTGPYALVPYAMAPLVLLSLLKFLTEKNNFYSVLFLITTGFETFFDPYAIIYIFLLTAVYMVFLCCLPGSKARIRSAWPLFISPLVSFLINLPHFAVPIFQYLQLSPIKYVFLPINVVESRTFHVYSGVTLLNLFRLLGGPQETANLYMRIFSLWSPAGFIPLIIATSSFFFKGQRIIERVKIASGFTIISIVLLVLLIKNNLLDVNLIPPLAIFRDTARLLFLISFCCSTLVGLAMAGISGKAKTSKLRKYVLDSMILLLLTSTVIYNAGGLNGSFGWFAVYDKSKVTVPEQYISALNWLAVKRGQEGLFRTLWLPWNYRTFIQITAFEQFLFGTWPGSEQWDYPNIDLVNSIFKIIANQSTSHLGSYLSPFAVKYIIVPLINSSEHKIQIINLFTKVLGVEGSPYEFIRFLNSQADLRLVYSSADFFAYENLEFTPYIATYNSSVMLMNFQTTDMNKLNLVYDIPGFEAKNNLIFFPWGMSTQEIRQLSSIVNTVIYFDPALIDLHSKATLVFIFDSSIKCPSELQITTDSANDSTLYIAVRSNYQPSVSVGVADNMQSIEFQSNNSMGWYFGETKILRGERASIVINECSSVQEILFSNRDVKDLFSFVNNSRSDRVNGGDWLMLSTTFDKSWVSKNSLLHVEAFGYANAFYGSSLGGPYNNLQLPYDILLLVSLITCLILVVFLGITYGKRFVKYWH
jgi:hypothetical protein